ncbi:hypothetical protein [Bordetella sp. LUAb4]|uniref:hypothetical protein n=1 Tax=Bordetella sp. LUAb4 TaxID=2843195 RepID=UPI001E53BB76|nr:hypothetical protein [Bordetella sp. LUAb4]
MKDVSNSAIDRQRAGSAPLRDLLTILPTLTTLSDGSIDFAAIDAEILQKLAAYADSAMRTTHQGISAIGLLLAQVDSSALSSAVEPRGSISAVGWLLADLGEVLLHLYQLSVTCRLHIADYAP